MMRDVFETSRLRLRPLAKKDAALFRALYSDAETMRFIARPMSEKQALASFEVTLSTRKSHRPMFFTIAEKKRDAAIGLCAIQAPELRERRAEIGLMLIRKACRLGFGKECIQALIEVAFEALPIDTVWVQYRPANAAAEKLFGGLDFLPITGVRPRAARRSHCIRAMQRSMWHVHNQPSGENTMSNTISFLESIGRDAALRHATGGVLAAAMRRERIAPELQAAILDQGSTQIGEHLGVREKIHCLNFPKKAPMKAPAKSPGKPAKAPSKKPAKKPAKASAWKPGKKAAPTQHPVLH